MPVDGDRTLRRPTPLTWTCAGLTPLLYVIWVAHFAVDSLFGDDWNMVPGIDAALHGRFRPGDVWAQYQETRVPVVHLVFLVFAEADRLDTRAVIVLNAVGFRRFLRRGARLLSPIPPPRAHPATGAPGRGDLVQPRRRGDGVLGLPDRVVPGRVLLPRCHGLPAAPRTLQPGLAGSGGFSRSRGKPVLRPGIHRPAAGRGRHRMDVVDQTGLGPTHGRMVDCRRSYPGRLSGRLRHVPDRMRPILWMCRGGWHTATLRPPFATSF